MIDEIADALLEDHVELMNENRSLLTALAKKDDEIAELKLEIKQMREAL
jgi:hypothetical protein